MNVCNELKWLKIKGMGTFLEWFRRIKKNILTFAQTILIVRVKNKEINKNEI